MKSQELLSELKRLELADVISLYMEARTGSNEVEDSLPCEVVHQIRELEDNINIALKGKIYSSDN